MVTKDDIVQAKKVLRGPVAHTPLVPSITFSRMFGADIYLKLENLQRTGSFKIRGALHKILKCRDMFFPAGVVAASAGNHAQGVALAAQEAGISSLIVMPEWASLSKQEATLSYGGQLLIYGQSVGESLDKAREIAEGGKGFIHPFDDDDVISGQGTIAIEILEDLKDVDIIVVPVGGGGLISGIAIFGKSVNPKVKIVGVQSAVCPSAYESVKKGRIVNVRSAPSIADGINVRRIGDRNYAIIKKYVDEIVTVEEEHIAAALLLLLERKKILVEGAGAIPLAALLSRSFEYKKDCKIVLVLSGGNVDSALLDRIIKKGMLKSGRIMTFSVRLNDSPGALAHLLNLIAKLKANVLDIHHYRNIKMLPIGETRVELELETRGDSHVEAIYAALGKKGYTVISHDGVQF